MQKAYIIPSKINPVTIQIPGSKSYTNRALIIASLAKGETKLINPLFSDDTVYTVEALKKIGVKISKNEVGNLIINGNGGIFKDPGETLFLGNAGTGIRFLAALLSIAPFKSKITGNKRMQERPIKDLISSLRQLGIKIESVFKNGCPPIKIKGKKIEGGTIEISGKISSQYLSAILMISPFSEEDLKIEIKDELVSKPYIDMTIQIMNDFGIEVVNNNYKSFVIKSGQKYKSCEYKIEGDASSASYFFALSALHKTPLIIQNINADSLQADIHFLDILEKMGCKIEENEKGIQVKSLGDLGSLGDIDLNHMPDAAMTVAIMSCFAKGKSRLTNIENLRVKECDRIKALVCELKKVGVVCKELKDGIEINGDPKKLHGNALISTYNDHRMAMCGALLAGKIPNIQILDPDCTSKTYPNFFDHLKKTGLEVKIKKIPNIILTGMRGSGKTTIGKIIASKIDKKIIDSDKEIIKQEGMDIPEIVKKHNWFYFRKKEKYVIRRISKYKDVIISTGGGVILDKENIKSLKKNGVIVFLNYPIEVLEKRLLKSKTKRPALTSKKSIHEELNEIWNKRKKKYKESADIIYNANKNIEVEEKAEKIIMMV